MERYKIKRKQADGSFIELSLDTSIDSVYRVKDGNIKSLTDILTEEYAPKDNPVFTGSISLGRKAGTTIGEGSYAVGVELEASGDYSHAEGGYNVASAENAHVEGNTSRALGKYSHAEGNNCEASEWGAHAEGRDTKASGIRSHAEGFCSHATGGNSHAEGYNTVSSGNNSHAEGYESSASGGTSHAEGYKCSASKSYSHAEGYMTKASSVGQHVQGMCNIEDTANKYAHIVGNGTKTATSNAHTLDWEGNAWYAGQVEGTNLPYNISSRVLATIPANTINLDTDATVNNASINEDKRYYIEFLGVKKLCSLSLDYEDNNVIICSINNYRIIAVNNSTNITLMIEKIDENINDVTFTDLVIHEEENKYLDSKYLEYDLILQNSISLGRVGNIGPGSSAIGYGVKALGPYSHTEGAYTTASGYASHAEGNFTAASGDSSHAEGEATTASGDQSHAEGAYTTASGYASHAEGHDTTASGYRSHAEGSTTTALGYISHAEGFQTKASGKYQHVQGKFNIEDTANKYAHIVGNGTSDTARSNAHTLDWEGNAWFAGEVQGTNLPYVISENTICTITNVQQTLNHLSSEITHDHPYIRSVGESDFNLVSGENISYFVKYSGKEYPVIMVGTAMYCNTSEFEMYVDLGEISTLANDPSGGRDITFYIYRIDKSSPTDIVLVSREIKYLDDKYLPKHITVEEDIVIGGVGIQYNEPQNDNELANKIYVDDTVVFNKLSSIIELDSSGKKIINVEKFEDNKVHYFINDINESATTLVSISLNKNNEKVNTIVLYPNDRFITMIYKSSTNEFFKFSDMESVKYNVVDKTREYNNSRSVTKKADTDQVLTKTNTTAYTPTADYHPVTKKYVDDNRVTKTSELTNDTGFLTEHQSLDGLATETYVNNKVSGLVDSAPEALDTLKELSTALGDDPNFATTVATNIGSKLNKPATEGTEGQVLSKAADGSNVWVDNGIDEDALNTMLTDTFGFVGNVAN